MDYLTDVQYGAATKRWQAAYELSKLLAHPEQVPLDDGFHQKMISVYEYSIHDDPMVRMYLALAMGRTSKKIYGKPLLTGLEDKEKGSRVAAIKALGNLQYLPAQKAIFEFTKEAYSKKERLAATIALGNMKDPAVIPILQKLLKDEEANIRWDAAIALAKLGNDAGVLIIKNLLDRNYFKNFKEVDAEEEVQAILVAIKATSIIPTEKFINNLIRLATLDHNMQIRDLAIKTLEKTYNRKI